MGSLRFAARWLGPVLLASAAGACSAKLAEPSAPHAAGAGGAAAGEGGSSGLGGAGRGTGGALLADAGSPTYGVVIRAERDALCPGECTELSAEAYGGHPPYAYAWSVGLGEGAGPHEVCPAASTTYAVTARDTGLDSEELGRPSQASSAELEVRVMSADDGACASPDGGVPPSRETMELCSIALRYDHPELAFSDLNVELGSRLATDLEGNVYVAGAFAGTLDFGGGRALEGNPRGSAFVAKYSAACEPQWVQTFGSVDATITFQAVSASPTGEVAAGGRLLGRVAIGDDVLVSPGIFDAGVLVMLDGATGAPRWAKRYGQAELATLIWQVAFDGASTLVFTGSSQGDLEIAGAPIGPSDTVGGFVARTSRDGVDLFGRLIQSASIYQRLAVNAAGDIAISSYGGGGLVQYGDDFIVTPSGELHRFAMLLDASGGFLYGRALIEQPWSHSLDTFATGGIALDDARTVWIEHGNFYDLTRENEAVPERLTRLAQDGSVEWTRDVSPAGWRPETQFPRGSIAVDSRGFIVHTDVIVNQADLSIAPFDYPPNDVHVQKLAHDGSRIWSHVLSTDVYESLWGLAIAPDDAIWIGHGTLPSIEPRQGTLRITKLAP